MPCSLGAEGQEPRGPSVTWTTLVTVVALFALSLAGITGFLAWRCGIRMAENNYTREIMAIRQLEEALHQYHLVHGAFPPPRSHVYEAGSPVVFGSLVVLGVSEEAVWMYSGVAPTHLCRLELRADGHLLLSRWLEDEVPRDLK